MKLEQISIFLENKPGGLSGVTKALRDAGINIRALSLADTSDFGILRLIVDDVSKAKEVLNTNGFAVGRTNVVAVEVPDKPGGLHGILDALTEEGGECGIHVCLCRAKRRECSDYLPVRRHRQCHRDPSEKRLQGVARGEGLRPLAGKCNPCRTPIHKKEDYGQNHNTDL